MDILDRIDELISEASTLSSVGVPPQLIKLIHTHFGLKHDMTYEKVNGKREATNELMNKSRLLVCHDKNGKTVVIAPPQFWDSKYYKIYELKEGATKPEVYTARTKKDVNRAIPSRGDFYVSTTSSIGAGTGKDTSDWQMEKDQKMEVSAKARTQVEKSISGALKLKGKELYDTSMRELHSALNGADAKDIADILSNDYRWGGDKSPLERSLKKMQRAKTMQEAQDSTHFSGLFNEINPVLRQIYPQIEDAWRYLGSYGDKEYDYFLKAVVWLAYGDKDEYGDNPRASVGTPEAIVRKVIAQWMKTL